MKSSLISNHTGTSFLKKTILFSAKHKLFNGIVDMFLASEDKFPVVMTDNVISDQVIMPLTNAVWYISGNMGTIQERSKHLPNVQGIPATYLI